MSVTIEHIRNAFDQLYVALQRRDAGNLLGLGGYSERKLLPIARTFLLGYFGQSALPDPQDKVLASLLDKGELDFLIGNIAIELVVRKKGKKRIEPSRISSLSSTGVGNLLRPDGAVLLILFDFAKSPLASDDISRFSTWAVPGKAGGEIAAFNVSYYYPSAELPHGAGRIDKTIRVEQAADAQL